MAENAMITENELNSFAQIINECRLLFTSIKVIQRISLSYVLFQLYGKMLLTMCEIYILLVHGYPEGAMALARNTFETLVIMDYLNNHKKDSKLIERFCDDLSVKTCTDEIKYQKWLNDSEDEETRISETLDELETQFEHLLQKHSDFTPKRNEKPYFSQYWWAGKGMTFNRLANETEYKTNYLYDISCYRVHAGMPGMLRFDNTEEGMLIGSCKEGKEVPMFFSLLNLHEGTRLYFCAQDKDCSQVLKEIDCLIHIVKDGHPISREA